MSSVIQYMKFDSDFAFCEAYLKNIYKFVSFIMGQCS